MSGFFKIPTLAEVLVRGSETGGTDLTVTSGDAIITGAGSFPVEGANGELVTTTTVSELVATTGGVPTVSTANIIPAGAIRLGATIRINTTVTGPTSFNIGDGVTANIFGTVSVLTAGTATSSVDFTANPTTSWSGSAGAITLTAVGGSGTFTAGAVRVSVHYIGLTGPTS